MTFDSLLKINRDFHTLLDINFRDKITSLNVESHKHNCISKNN